MSTTLLVRNMQEAPRAEQEIRSRFLDLLRRGVEGGSSLETQTNVLINLLAELMANDILDSAAESNSQAAIRLFLVKRFAVAYNDAKRLK